MPINPVNFDFAVRPTNGAQAEWLNGSTFDFSSAWLITVSPVSGKGATFDPSTPGTTSGGILEAFASQQSTGRDIYFMEGTYILGTSPLVYLTGGNAKIYASAGALFVINAANIGVTTAAGVIRYPAFVFSSVTDLVWEGGQFTSAAGSPNYSGSFLVADNCTRVTIRRTYHTGVNGWPILCNPTYKLNNGTDTIHNVAGIYQFCEEYNTFVGCGNTSVPDGGGVRLANDSGSVTFYQCSGAFLGHGDRVINSNIFAYDILNSTQYGWDSIFIEGYDIDFGTAVSTPQKIGINLERLTDTTHLNGKVYIGPGRVSGAYKGIQIQTGWKYINIDRAIAEYCYQTGIYIDGTIQGLNVSGPICRNNNQNGSTTGNSLRCGMFIGSSANIGTLQNGQVQGGQYFDDQATPTQLYGVVYGAVSGASMLNFLFQGTASGMWGNKTSNAILEVTGGTITNVTVVN